MTNHLIVQSVSKSFGKTQAVKEVSFDVGESEVVAILGPSGCGKSTLLNLIAGLDQPDSGKIFWKNISLEHIPVYQRGFGLMFQDFALFPHYNVLDNVGFGLRMAHKSKEQIHQRVAEVLDLVGLPGFEKRDVNTLSGGENQRVALARALAPYPNLLMLDEPLGSLDRNLRERLVFDLRDILEKSRQTAIYVTHDQEEAFVIADRIIIMNSGHIEQIGSPQQIYHHPSCQFVANFLGLSNQVSGRIEYKNGKAIIHTSIGDFSLEEWNGKENVTVLLRPDAVMLGDMGIHKLTGIVEDLTFRGSASKVSLLISENHFTFDFPSNIDLPQKDEEIKISFDPAEAIQVFPEQ